jgi:hypothetical protein
MRTLRISASAADCTAASLMISAGLVVGDKRLGLGAARERVVRHRNLDSIRQLVPNDGVPAGLSPLAASIAPAVSRDGSCPATASASRLERPGGPAHHAPASATDLTPLRRAVGGRARGGPARSARARRCPRRRRPRRKLALALGLEQPAHTGVVKVGVELIERLEPGFALHGGRWYAARAMRNRQRP